MAESVINKYFPSQAVSDIEKMSYDYGLKVAKAIEAEWDVFFVLWVWHITHVIRL